GFASGRWPCRGWRRARPPCGRDQPGALALPRQLVSLTRELLPLPGEVLPLSGELLPLSGELLPLSGELLPLPGELLALRSRPLDVEPELPVEAGEGRHQGLPGGPRRLDGGRQPAPVGGGRPAFPRRPPPRRVPPQPAAA